MTIGALTNVRVQTASTPAAATDASAPDELVGSGDTSARWFGGAVGLGLGVGAFAGITSLAARGPQAARIAGGIAGLAALGGLPFLGQKLMGHATRSTQAEVTREATAKRDDVAIEIRTLQAKQRGDLTAEDEAKVKELRATRQELAQGRPEQGWVGKYALPLGLAAAIGVGAAVGAYKLTPDDGKGINSMFNGMFGAIGGAAAGGWAGSEIGAIVASGPHMTELPVDTKDRIAAIDRELDGLLGPA